MLRKALALACLLLLGLSAEGCVSAEQRRQEEQRAFESMMARSVGQATYEQILTYFGPPTRKTETTTGITAVWDDPTGYGFRKDRPDGSVALFPRQQGEPVRMVFDRRTQVLKSWDYPDRPQTAP